MSRPIEKYKMQDYRSKKGAPLTGESGGAAGGGTHLFDPLVEVVEKTRPSQLRDTPEGVVASWRMYSEE